MSEISSPKLTKVQIHKQNDLFWYVIVIIG